METIKYQDVKHVAIGDLAKLPAETLYLLIKQAKEKLEEAKLTHDWLTSVLSLKYEESVLAKRQRLTKETGIIHIEDGDYKLTNDVPKKPEWDQNKLLQIIAGIQKQGDDPSEYVTIKTTYKVPESKYQAWPDSIKKV